MGVEPKIGGFAPQNGWWFIMENPMNKWDDLGGFPPYFWKHPYEITQYTFQQPSFSKRPMTFSTSRKFSPTARTRISASVSFGTARVSWSTGLAKILLMKSDDTNRFSEWIICIHIHIYYVIICYYINCRFWMYQPTIYLYLKYSRCIKTYQNNHGRFQYVSHLISLENVAAFTLRDSGRPASSWRGCRLGWHWSPSFPHQPTNRLPTSASLPYQETGRHQQLTCLQWQGFGTWKARHHGSILGDRHFCFGLAGWFMEITAIHLS